MAATIIGNNVQLARVFGRLFTRIESRKTINRVARTGCVLVGLVKKRNYSTAEAAPKTSRTSRLFGAVCVQRLPLITREKSELEIRYQELQDQLELEHSVLSDDEVELKGILTRKKKLKDDDDDESISIRIFEEDKKVFEEEQEEQLRKFEPAGRETEADKLNNLKSLDRKLQETLVLLVKKHSDADTWEVPQGEVNGTSESLKQVASRSLDEACSTDLTVQFLSTLPIAVLKNYNNGVNKVFFYKANYVNGSVKLAEDYCDHMWVGQNEIKDFVHPEYYKILKKFLF